MSGKKKRATLLPPDESEAVEAPAPKAGVRARLGIFFAGIFAKIPNPFATPEIKDDIVNERLEIGRADRAFKRLTRGAIAIAICGVLLAFGAPFFAPIYRYHAITPEGRTSLLLPLELPNLTNPAVVSWAANSVTEILSFGFGDVEQKVLLQKKSFTKGGWAAFVKTFMDKQVSQSFKASQMVMTTVPTDVAVIIKQGVNEDGAYQWKVEVPIITTYVGNNNVMKPWPGTIEMTIVRVPPTENPAGIAIDIWRWIQH